MAVWIKGTESILKKTQKPINSKYKDCAALSLFPGHSLSSTHCSSSKKEKKKKVEFLHIFQVLEIQRCQLQKPI